MLLSLKRFRRDKNFDLFRQSDGIKGVKMKKLLSLFIIAAMALGFSACLAGCNALPTSAYEKVLFALNGVEKSFRSSDKKSEVNKSGGYSLFLSPSKKVYADESQALAAISAIYNDGDVFEQSEDSFAYDEPPMIQFQCLKAVFERIGKDYSFGTKYYSDVNGELYIDIETGDKIDELRSDAADYKYDYTFGLAISVNIDDSDLITADVSFDITIYRENERYHTNWYVSMRLDYDMRSSSPNYTLLMLTDNQEAELKYLNRIQGYEYDYVQVKDSRIVEWRKFDLDASEKLIFDDSHPNFDSYLNNEDFEFKAGTTKWFKDGKLRKITRMTSEKSLTVARAYADGLKMNSTDINGEEFLNKNGEKTDKINEIYREFCTLFKGDVIYSLVLNSSSKHGGEQGDGATGIVFYADSIGSEYQSFVIFEDMTGLQFLTEDQVAKGQVIPHPSFYYRVGENGRGEKITDLTSAVFDFYSFDSQNDIPNVSLSYSDFITSSMQNILEICGYGARLHLTVNGQSGDIVIYIFDKGGSHGNQSQINGIIFYADSIGLEYHNIVIPEDMTGYEYLTQDRYAPDGKILYHPSFYYRIDGNGRGDKIEDLTSAVFEFYSLNGQEKTPRFTFDYKGFTNCSLEDVLSDCGYKALFTITVNGYSGGIEMYLYAPDYQGGGQSGNEGGDNEEENTEDKQVVGIKIVDENTYQDIDTILLGGNESLYKIFSEGYTASEMNPVRFIKPCVYYVNSNGELLEKADVSDMEGYGATLTARLLNYETDDIEIIFDNDLLYIYFMLAPRVVEEEPYTAELKIALNGMTDEILLVYFSSQKDRLFAEAQNSWQPIIFTRNGFDLNFCPEFNVNENLYGGPYKYQIYTCFDGNVFIAVNATESEMKKYLQTISRTYEYNESNDEYVYETKDAKFIFKYYNLGDRYSLNYSKQPK